LTERRRGSLIKRRNCKDSCGWSARDLGVDTQTSRQRIEQARRSQPSVAVAIRAGSSRGPLRPVGRSPRGTRPPGLRVAMERHVCRDPVQQFYTLVTQVLQREISNECDPNREEGRNHKANERKNGCKQVHGSPRTPSWAGVGIEARHGPIDKHHQIKHLQAGVRNQSESKPPDCAIAG
jgi:hypothetical protein